MKKTLMVVGLSLLWSFATAQTWTREQVEKYSNTGKTLPLEFYDQSPKEALQVPNDKGYNILIDVAHVCNFSMMWGVPPRIQQLGYRSHASHASLNSVLDPTGKHRRRLPYDMKGKYRPFGWCPNLAYNLVITYQGDPTQQPYTAKEIKALVNHVEKGGSLLILTNTTNEDRRASWSMNTLLKAFDTEITGKTKINKHTYATFKTTPDWKIEKGAANEAYQINREFGKGRVTVIGNAGAFDMVGNKASKQEKEQELAYINSTIDWLCRDQKPVGGYFPTRTGGGGDIYPEQELNSRGIVIYYAENQFKDLIECVENECPKITDQIFDWYPSQPTKEPMYLLLAAGSGGGWAVNAWYPKENGIISQSKEGIISIFAHELAHTMKGPLNHKGETAGIPPIGNSGEAHAGWYQGKIDATYNVKRAEQPNRGCNQIFESDKFQKLDFVKYYENEAGREQFGKGSGWQKAWYIWQRLDDTYGPAWYPRWKWVQHTRWADTPDHKLSWEEMVEDMSIAVNADLFPFFQECGISLNREKIGKLKFQGKNVKLKPAKIEVTTPGKVRLEAIANYKQKL